MSTQKTNRNIYLDYIRGIACILIVLYHYTQRYNELFQNSGEWKFRVSWGYMAVSTFFVLSGYLAIAKDDSNLGLWTYIKKRAVRLFPAYWVSIPLTFVTTHFLLSSRSVSIKDALINLTMLESFVGVPLVDGVYWTLANELVFYAFVAIVVVVLKKRNILPLFGFTWIVALLIFRFVENDSLICAAIGKLIAKQYGHMFVVGASLVYLFHGIGNKFSKFLSVLSILIALVYQFLIFGFNYSIYFVLSLIVVILCVVFDIRRYIINERFLKILRPLELTAAISYPLYLIHQNIGYAIMETFRPIITKTEWIIIFPMVIVFATSYVIHRFVEIPISNLSRNKS